MSKCEISGTVKVIASFNELDNTSNIIIKLTKRNIKQTINYFAA